MKYNKWNLSIYKTEKNGNLPKLKIKEYLK